LEVYKIKRVVNPEFDCANEAIKQLIGGPGSEVEILTSRIRVPLYNRKRDFWLAYGGRIRGIGTGA
jgi:hypothetical protein